MSDVDRLMRSYNRYTGDGLPGEPEDAPLPVGDPSSGVFNPKREELRSWGNAIVGAVADHALAAGQSEEAAVAAAGAVAAASGLVAEAVSAAEVSGIAVIYDTKAAADAALAGLSEDDVVEVLADESQDDARTRYRVEGGLLVFKLRLGGLRPDQNLSDVPDPVAARNALGVELSAAGEMTVPYYLRVGFGDDATAGAWDAAYAFNVKGLSRLENRLDIEGDYLGSWPRVRLRGPLSEGGSPSTFLDMLYDRANGHLEMKLRDEAGGNPDSYYFGHALHGLWEKSVLRKVDADALYKPIGAAGPGLELIQHTVLAGDTAADFTAFDATKYSSYEFILSNVEPSTDGAFLRVRTSSDAGASFDAGGTNYGYKGLDHRTGSSADDHDAATAEFIEITKGVGNVNSRETGVCASLYLFDPAAATDTMMKVHGAYTNTANALTETTTVGKRRSNGAVDGLRFYFSAGNLATGSISMYGKRKL